MSNVLDVLNARGHVVSAALRLVQADYGDETHAFYSDECEYAAELLDLAARRLFEAVESLDDPRDQPIGWNDQKEKI